MLFYLIIPNRIILRKHNNDYEQWIILLKILNILFNIVS